MLFVCSGGRWRHCPSTSRCVVVRVRGTRSSLRRSLTPSWLIATTLSEGGMAVYFRSDLPKGGISRVIFTLPSTSTPLESKVHIAWVDGTGRAGLRFTNMPKDMQSQLDRWLIEQFDKLDKSQQKRS